MAVYKFTSLLIVSEWVGEISYSRQSKHKAISFQTVACGLNPSLAVITKLHSQALSCGSESSSGFNNENILRRLFSSLQCSRVYVFRPPVLMCVCFHSSSAHVFMFSFFQCSYVYAFRPPVFMWLCFHASSVDVFMYLSPSVLMYMFSFLRNNVQDKC